MGYYDEVLRESIFLIQFRYMKIGDEDEQQLSAKDALIMWAQNKIKGLSLSNFFDLTRIQGR